MAIAIAPRRAKRESSKHQLAVGPRIYSYIRFSTPEQALGDSERRQLDAAKNYAKAAGLPFDEMLRMADLGKSAFRGRNRSHGALGHFLTSVEAGKVPHGSILVVESVDRVSRQEPVDALEVIVFGLIGKGIAVHSLERNATYDRAALNSGRIFELIVDIQRAHAESKLKSDRLQAAWKQKRMKAREKKTISTKMRPDWLDITADNEFQVRPGAAHALVLLFRLAEIGLGASTIAKRLNEKRLWIPQKKTKKRSNGSEQVCGWFRSYVQKLLRDRRLIGEYQPHRKVNCKRIPDGEPIPDFFPNIFAKHPGLFESIQKKFLANKGKHKGGRNDKASNLFLWLAKCAYCGGAMHFKNDGEGRSYLECYNAKNDKKVCQSPSIRYVEVEKLVLENCSRLRPEQVLPKQDAQFALCQVLRDSENRKEGEIHEKQSRIDNLNEQIETTRDKNQRDRYESRIKILDDEISQLKKELAECRSQLEKAEHGRESFVDWQADFEQLTKAISNKGNVEIRQRLNAHLRDFIDRIEIFAIGHKNEYDPDTDDGDSFYEESADQLESEASIRKYRPFIRYVIKRRMTKEGRFIRVHWKTGNSMDMVPEGSLASGIRLVNGGRPVEDEDGDVSAFAFEIVGPDVDRLYREFSRQNNKSSKAG